MKKLKYVLGLVLAVFIVSHLDIDANAFTITDDMADNYEKVWNLTEDTVIDDDLYLNGHKISVSEFTLTVTGNLYVNSDKVYIDGGTLNVNKNVYLTGGVIGPRYGSSPLSTVSIDGDFVLEEPARAQTLSLEKLRLSVGGDIISKSDELRLVIDSLKLGGDILLGDSSASINNLFLTGNGEHTLDVSDSVSIKYITPAKAGDTIKVKNNMPESFLEDMRVEASSEDSTIHIDNGLKLDGRKLTIVGNVDSYSFISAKNSEVRIEGSFSQLDTYEFMMEESQIYVTGDFEARYDGALARGGIISSNSKIFVDGNASVDARDIFGNTVNIWVKGDIDCISKEATVVIGLINEDVNKVQSVTGKGKHVKLNLKKDPYKYEVSDLIEFSFSQAESGYYTINGKTDWYEIKNGEYTIGEPSMGEPSIGEPQCVHLYWVAGEFTPATFNKDGGTKRICKECGNELNYEAVIPSIEKIVITDHSVFTDSGFSKPLFTVYDREGNEVPLGYYDIKYKNYKKVGTGTAVFQFKGQYSGKKEVKFDVVPPPPPFGACPASKGMQITICNYSHFDGFEIYKKEGKNYKKIKKIAAKRADIDTVWTDKNVKAGKVYSYKLVGYKKVGKTTYKTEYSSEERVCFLQSPHLDYQFDRSTRKLTAKWTKVNKADGYEIDNGTKCKLLKGKSNLKKEYSIPYDKNISIRVRAYKIVNGKKYYSDYSNEEIWVSTITFNGKYKVISVDLFDEKNGIMIK